MVHFVDLGMCTDLFQCASAENTVEESPSDIQASWRESRLFLRLLLEKWGSPAESARRNNYDKIVLKSKNKLPERIIVAGRVNTHVSAIVFTVPF